MIIMKFGGALLSTAAAILHTCRIIRSYRTKNKIVLVVSVKCNA
ncbi:MAG: hypothetical protein HYW86_04510 [Candidatus Roizmanbacteria bacterium]|nr:MAG: hypothetical protein HYW86_04510 [Candidatus Roizmanbacteria bacterium]